MSIELDWSFDPAGIAMLVITIVLVVVGLMCWWEFYAKPCRESLRNIERALMAAPWMRSNSQTGMKRSA